MKLILWDILKRRNEMIKVKEMTYEKKYASVLDYTKLLESFVLPLVKKYLGNAGLAEIERKWQEKLNEIPENTSIEDKFEAAYCNWMWKWSIAYNFVKTNLGENGVEEFQKADVEALKKRDSYLAKLMLKGIRAVSPDTAFSMIGKQMAYEFQVFTPAGVTALSEQRATFELPRCKILDYPECEVMCLVGCQKIFPQWLAEQLYVKMETNRRGNSCAVTLTPIL